MTRIKVTVAIFARLNRIIKLSHLSHNEIEELVN